MPLPRRNRRRSDRPRSDLRRGDLRRSDRPRSERRDRGQVAIEYVGLLPILLLVGVACIQLGLAVYAVQQAGTAARAAARVASQEPHTTADPLSAGRAAISDWLSADITPSGGGFDSVRYTASVHIPSIVPGIDGFGTAQRSVTMPRD